MVVKIAREAQLLEIYGRHDVPELFPTRVVLRYRDAVARLQCAAADMHVFAKALDNAPKPDQLHVDISKRTYRGKGLKVRADKGTKRRHVRTRPISALPDAAVT